MSEGARKGKNFIAVCTSPDVCLTPLGPVMVPVPYQIVAILDDACMASDDVKFAGEPALVKDRSMVMKVVGNEAGVGGGIKSGHNRWLVEFDEGSSLIHINGQEVVRHGDTCWMNGRNTRGKVICTEEMGPACSISQGRPVANASTSGNPDGRSDTDLVSVKIRGCPSPPGPSIGAQSTALRRAALTGAPFCDT